MKINFKSLIVLIQIILFVNAYSFSQGKLLITNSLDSDVEISEVDFGDVHYLGATSVGYFFIKNAGDDTIRINSIKYSGSDEIKWRYPDTTSFNLLPNKYKIMNFQLQSKSIGKKIGYFKITSNVESEPRTITIKGNSIEIPLGPWDWKYIDLPDSLTNTVLDVTSLHPHFSNPEKWFLSSISNGLYVTNDKGKSWKEVIALSGLNSNGFGIREQKPDTIFAAVGRNFFRSFDEGETWQNTQTFPQSIRSILVSSFDSKIFVAPQWYDEESPGVYMSEDDGQTWRFLPFNISQKGIICWDIKEDKNNGNIFIACEINTPYRPTPYEPFIIRSFDRGNSWETKKTSYWHSTQIEINSETHEIYSLEESGGSSLFKSNDNGETWQYLYNKFSIDLLLNQANPSELFGGAHSAYSDGGVYYSSDSGNSFEFVGLKELTVGKLALNPTNNKIFVSCLGGAVFYCNIPNSINSIPQLVKQFADTTLQISSKILKYDLNNYFKDMDGDSLYYSVSSSDTSILETNIISSNTLEVIPKSIGTAIIDITCIDERLDSTFTEFNVELKEGTPTNIRIEKSIQNDIVVYPNPTDGELIIETPNADGSIIELFDLTGKSIFKTKINSTLSVIDIRNVEAGLYFLILTSKDRVMKQKIIKN